MYRTELRSEPRVAQANPEAAAQAIKLQGQATSGMLKTVAGTMFDAFQGYQEEGLRKGLQQETANIRGEMDSLKEADLVNKAQYEQDVLTKNSKVDEFRAAALLSGSDPEEAKQAAFKFGTQEENSIVSRFRSEQQRIQAALNDMPQRYHEFMVRSEKQLRNYITQYPGLADNFRKIAYAETGKEKLEFYTLNQLYSDVNQIEKQREQQAKAAQKVQDTLRSAYVTDRKNAGVSETVALMEFDSMTPPQRVEIAQASVNVANNKKLAEEALKRGGNDLLNFVTVTTTGFSSEVLLKQGKAFAQLAPLNISRADLASGNIPSSIQNNPKFQEIIRQSNNDILQSLDNNYFNALQQLNTKVTTNPAEADMVAKAKSNLEMWYKEQYKYYSDPKNTSGFLHAIAVDDGDPTSRMSKQLSIVQSMVQGLGLPPEVIAQLGGSGDSKTYNDAKVKYPKAAKIVDFMYGIRQKIASGLTGPEFQKEMSYLEQYKILDTTPPPATPQDSAGSLISHKKNVELLKGKLLSNAQITSDDVVSYIHSSVHQPANTEQVLKTEMPMVLNTLGKLSPSDKEIVTEVIKAASTKTIYQPLEAKGSADEAKTRLDAILNEQKANIRNKNVYYNFINSEGTAPLKVQIKVNRNVAATQTGQEILESRDIDPNKINSVLEHIDNVLRVRATITGEPINTLRKEFINTFNKEGLPSNAYTASLGQAQSQQMPTTKPTSTQADVRRVDVEAMSPKISPVTPTDVNKPLTPTEVVVGGTTEDNTKSLGLTSSDTLGYQTRGLFAGEDTYFKQNPNVAGMATEDGKIIINPYSTLSNTEKKAVVKNEAFRLYMRENNIIPKFNVTPQQKETFKNTEYGGDELALKQTIVARILTGDQSALATPKQKEEAKSIQQTIPITRPVTNTQVKGAPLTSLTSTQKVNEQTTTKTGAPNTSNVSPRTSTSEKWWR